MTQATQAGPRVYTVSELNRLVHDLLESSLGEIWVEGEISDPRPYPSGHTYFTLKDAESQISAVLFKGVAAGLRFKLEHGIAALVRGRVSSYIKRGQYQLIVTVIEPKAVGALQLAFEQLKAKLKAEGLFDEARKKPIPQFPERIGIVTSLKGAAVRDMLSILKRRFEGLHIRIYPVLVQGEGASAAIAEAIADFNAYFPDTDVLLVGRGGGSLEDLWAFNEEATARAIAASKIPIISCVGHETDFTIADFVADLRAPTPSAAAELVVEEREAVLAHLKTLKERLAPGLTARWRALKERLESLKSSPFLRQPGRILEQKAQRVDELAERLIPALRGLLRRLKERFKPLGAERLKGAIQQALAHAQKDLRRHMERLDALSPLKVLSRGYAIAFKLPGKTVLKSASDVKTSDEVRIRLHEGEFKAKVI